MAPESVTGIARPERDPRPGLSGLEPGDLEAWFSKRAQPTYRARQVGDAVWGGRAAATGEARTLPAALRAEVDAAFRFDTVADTELQTADGGLTEKALHRLSDGELVE
jgi:adenine C2-methylase RlmN of 23S rRNA A2503 and tRNA A37